MLVRVISSCKTRAGELRGCLESVVRYCLKDDKASLDALFFFLLLLDVM